MAKRLLAGPAALDALVADTGSAAGRRVQRSDAAADARLGQSVGPAYTTAGRAGAMTADLDAGPPYRCPNARVRRRPFAGDQRRRHPSGQRAARRWSTWRSCPRPSDRLLKCTNVRTVDGKRPPFVHDANSTVHPAAAHDPADRGSRPGRRRVANGRAGPGTDEQSRREPGRARSTKRPRKTCSRASARSDARTGAPAERLAPVLGSK